jgi:hypothetical protein
MLKYDMQFLIRYSETVPVFVTAYAPMLPWQQWPDRSNEEYGDLKLLSELSFGAEDKEKFSEAICKVVSNYTELELEVRRLAAKLGLIR